MNYFSTTPNLDRGRRLAERVEMFVREHVVPFERDPRQGLHGPGDELVQQMRDMARAEGLLTPNVLPDGSHLTHRETALVLRAAGLLPLGQPSLNRSATAGRSTSLCRRAATPPQK